MFQILAGLLALLSLWGCASPKGETASSWIVITDFPTWAPGRPQISRQVVFGADGSVQDATLRDQTVQRLTEHTAAPPAPGLFPVTPYASLRDRYETPPQPGVMVDGRGSRTNFYFRSPELTKFISAETALLPADLQRLRALLPANPAQGRTGTFLQVQVFEAATQQFLRNSSPVALTPAILSDFPELSRALATPFRLVDFQPEAAKALAERLTLRAPPFTVTTPAGEVVRLQIYR